MAETSFSQQYQKFIELNKADFNENEPVYVVSNKWLLKFKRADLIQSQSSFKRFPIPINNDHLYQANKLRPLSALVINKDYVYVNKAAWDYIFAIYGCSRIIKLNTYKDPKTGKLTPNPDAKVFKIWYKNQVQSFSIISVKKIHELKDLACEFFKVSSENTRLRNYFYFRIRDILDDSQIIEDCLCSGQDILLETRLSNGNWPQYKISNMKSPQSTSLFGLTGLYNLGNTCYMNSILQCLLHIPSLKEFYISNGKNLSLSTDYTMNGPLSYLFHLVWEEKAPVLSPFAILVATSTLRRYFNVHQQQDSHEFLTFILEKMHQEVITGDKTKVLPERPFGNENNYKELAEQVISSLRSKEDSPISQIFDFLTISKIMCDKCNSSQFSYQPDRFLEIDLHQDLHSIKTQVKFYSYRLGSPIISFKADFSGKTAEQIEAIIRSKISLPASSKIACAIQRDLNSFQIHFIPPSSTQSDLYVFELPDNISENSASENSDVQLTNSTNATNTTNPANATDTKDPIIEKGGHFILASVSVNYSSYVNTILIPYIMVPVSSENPTASEIEENLTRRLSSLLDDDIMDSSTYILRCVNIQNLDQSDDYKHPLLLPLTADVLLETSFQFSENIKFDLLQSSTLTIDPPEDENNSQLSLEQLILPRVSETVRKCEKCEETNTIESRIFKPPSCLIIQLKRFFISGNQMLKNSTPVSYPEILDLSPLLCPDEGRSNELSKYQLTGVSVHYGSLAAGHYIAECRNELDGKWYLFNDQMVSLINNFKPNPNAYILFYSRIDTIPLVQ